MNEPQLALQILISQGARVPSLAPTSGAPGTPADPSPRALGPSWTYAGRQTAHWHRALWLNPTFWDPAHLSPANGSTRTKSGPSRAASLGRVQIQLSEPGRPPTCLVTGPVGSQGPWPYGDFSTAGSWAFPIESGRLNLPPFHLRLPPGLICQLTRDHHQTVHFDLAHPLLGLFFSAHLQPASPPPNEEPLRC